MSFFHSLYLIVIYPLYQIIEFIYRVFYAVCDNEGYSIIGVSIGITILCLPLYAVAEKWQQKEREIQGEMQPQIKRIKQAFKGDEQYMMLSAFYKEKKYHPMMALRSSFSLLIQVPFFMAAYSFLSGATEIAGKSFLFISNLSFPDKLISLNGFEINILPILMTLINVVAGAIYTKGFKIREKAQIYVMAIIFLVILYPSPSGLVLYWTMNNVFSLMKNIFYKLKNPLKAFYFFTVFILILLNIYLIKNNYKHTIPIHILSGLIITMPLLKSILASFFKKPIEYLLNDTKNCNRQFIIASINLFLLVGLVIPSLLISSSPSEYSYIDNYASPFFFLFNTAFQSFGLLFFWPICIYFLFDKKIQGYLTIFFIVLLFSSISNTFVFQGNYGTILPELIFPEHRSFFPSKLEFVLNSLSLLFIFCIILFLFIKYKPTIINTLLVITTMVLSLSIIGTCFIIKKEFKSTVKKDYQLEDIEPIIHLSKNNKNVIVFMLDRAAGYLLPELFNELPQLKDDFRGFTNYPNTVSFASWTIQGAPCLYGGYEYTPWEMNHRRELPMVEKHNQALSLMPFIFEANGFDCDVIDPPYPNYDTEPIYEMFENHKNIRAVTAKGKYDSIWYKENNYTPLPIKSTLIKRNMLWFSIFKISPLILRPAIHFQDWWQEDDSTSDLIGISDFVKSYSVLDFLTELTNTDSENPNFILIDNEATHDTAFCQAPEYRPAETITNYGTSKWSDDRGYHGFAASFYRIAEWLEYLKQENVYDNTRIIIVADHGSTQSSDLFEGADISRSCEWFNPILMVKDFNSNGEFNNMDEFMTNADTPSLAMKDLISNPINPFTGKEINVLTTEEKNNRSIISVSGANAVRTSVNNGFRIKDNEWVCVHDSIFKRANWEKPIIINGEKQ